MPSKITASAKVGDIFACSWGYEQTNWDFYKVVAVHGKSADLRQLEQRYFEDSPTSMTGRTVPIPDRFKDKTGGGLCDDCATKRVFPYSWPPEAFAPGVFVKSQYGCAHLWDGKPCSYSSYA